MCVLQSEMRILTTGLNGLQRCSVYTAHTTTSSECHVPEVDFNRQEINVRLSVDTLASKLATLTGTPDSF